MTAVNKAVLREYAEALRHLVLERGADISLHYEGARDGLKRPDEDCVESALHEIAHAVCLDMDINGSWRWWNLTSDVSVEMTFMAHDDFRLEQEAWTIAAEVLVLQQLGFKAWRYVIEGAVYQPWTKKRFVSLIRSSMKHPETYRRSRRVLYMFKEACELGKKRR